MNRDYIRSKTKQLSLTCSQTQQDKLLYHIGIDANPITFEDANKIQGGHLSQKCDRGFSLGCDAMLMKLV